MCLTDTSTLMSGKLLRLSCSHVLCGDCADAASSRGLAACPICRTPQLLDRAELAKRTQEFRTEYNAWRAGASRGSTGELNEISAPAKPKGLASSIGLHSSSAGDLALLAEPQQAHAPTRSRPTTLGSAICGVGRAGRIHQEVLAARDDVSLRWLIDLNLESMQAPPRSADQLPMTTTKLSDALEDPRVHCVIVSTPTPSHAPLIRAALAAGKHVFAEKPLCCEPSDVPSLFALAERQQLVLHTAYNRRHDPAINEAVDAVRSRSKGAVLGVSLVSRDYPYPPAHYLATSGNLFKDCVVHDLDYLTWMLDEMPTSVRAHASSSASERSGGMYEYSSVQLTFASSGPATLINARVADSYDHRLDVYCEHGAIKVDNPTTVGGKTTAITFSERFAAS